MKLIKRSLTQAFFCLSLLFVGCSGNSTKEGRAKEIDLSQKQNVDTANMHSKQNSLYDNFAHKDIVILDNPYKLSETSKAEMEQVIDTYLQLKDAFVNDDSATAYKLALEMSKKVTAVIPVNLKEAGLKAWQNHKVLYLDKLEKMRQVKGLENKRAYFSHISEILYCTIKSFGLKQGKLFTVFCPMAFNKKGAYWITDSKVIRNPYMGSKMPSCGEIKEKL